MEANFKHLSAYTVAKYCCDLTDINDGISELKQYFDNCEKEGVKPVKLAYIRFYKLHEKKDKLNQK